MKRKLLLVSTFFLLIFNAASANELEPLTLDWETAYTGDYIYSMDIDGDDIVEIIAVSFASPVRGRIYILDNKGYLKRDYGITPIWPDNVVYSAYLTDLDSNDDYDIVIGSEMHGQDRYLLPLYTMEIKKDLKYPTLKWAHWNYDLVRSIYTTNMDAGAGEEIIAGSRSGVLLLNKDGSLLWKYEIKADVWSVYADNVDNVSGKEVIAGSGDKGLYVIGADGKLKWKRVLNDSVRVVLSSDLDDDGLQEILALTRDNNIYAFDGQGNLLWRYRIDGLKQTLATADLDNDGVREVLVGSNGGYIYSLSPSGNLNWEHNIGNLVDYIHAADLDNDGKDEVLVSNYQDIFVFSVNSAYLRKADADYYASEALKLIESGDYFDAIQASTTSRQIYSEINYTEGLDETQSLLSLADSYIAARSHLNNATAFYDAGMYGKSLESAQNSKAIFESIGELQNVPILDDIINRSQTYMWAQEYFEDAQYSYRIGEFREGELYAQKSKELYIWLNDSAGTSKCEILIKNSQEYVRATFYYDKAVEEYEAGEYELANSYAQKALELYDRLGDTDGEEDARVMIDKVENAVQSSHLLVNAKSQFEEAQKSYEQGNYEVAKSYASAAMEIYAELADSEGVATAESIIALSQERIDYQTVLFTAESYYVEGVNHFNGQEYELAKSYGTKARESFSAISNDEGISRADYLIQQADEQLEAKQTRYRLYMLGLLAAVLLVIAFVVVVAMRGTLVRGTKSLNRRIRDITIRKEPKKKREETRIAKILLEKDKELPKEETPEAKAEETETKEAGKDEPTEEPEEKPKIPTKEELDELAKKYLSEAEEPEVPEETEESEEISEAERIKEELKKIDERLKKI